MLTTSLQLKQTSRSPNKSRFGQTQITIVMHRGDLMRSALCLVVWKCSAPRFPATSAIGQKHRSDTFKAPQNSQGKPAEAVNFCQRCTSEVGLDGADSCSWTWQSYFGAMKYGWFVGAIHQSSQEGVLSSCNSTHRPNGTLSPGIFPKLKSSYLSLHPKSAWTWIKHHPGLAVNHHEQSTANQRWPSTCRSPYAAPSERSKQPENFGNQMQPEFKISKLHQDSLFSSVLIGSHLFSVLWVSCLSLLYVCVP